MFARRSLSALAVAALAGSALLVPSVADAKVHTSWDLKHSSTSHPRPRITDPGNDITWTIANHEVLVVTPTLVAVPFVYTCTTDAADKDIDFDPAAFQPVYTGATALATSDQTFPVFTCDGVQHSLVVSLSADPEHSQTFQNGNVEVGLAKADEDSAPTFEHAVVGYGVKGDTRAPVAVTVDAHPETTRAGGTITVDGTVKRAGKAYDGKAAALYFQSRAGDPAIKIGSDTADSKGNVSTKVTVRGAGTYFWITTSTSKTQAGASTGDYAAAS